MRAASSSEQPALKDVLRQPVARHLFGALDMLHNLPLSFLRESVALRTQKNLVENLSVGRVQLDRLARHALHEFSSLVLPQGIVQHEHRKAY
jgi:hypothetical protein